MCERALHGVRSEHVSKVNQGTAAQTSRAPCAAGKVSDAGQSVCLPCKPGENKLDGGTCGPMRSWHILASVGAVSFLYRVRARTGRRYQNAKAQCIACGAGTYGDQAGQVAVGTGPGDGCKNCGVGRYSSALCATATRNATRVPRARPVTSNAAGQTVASADIDCNTGQYSANEGSAACINCGVGLVSKKRPANQVGNTVTVVLL